jgi:hypothetical protein
MDQRLVKILINDEIKIHTYEFLQTKAGQRILEEVKNHENLISCICTGKDLPLHVAKFGDKYAIRTNPGTKHLHDKSCPHFEESEEVARKDRETKESSSISIIEDNGIKGMIFNFKDNEITKITDNTDKSKTKAKDSHRKANTHTRLYTVTETLLSLAWENHIMQRGFVPYEGNIFFQIYNSMIKNSRNTDGELLSNFMYVPLYSKDLADNDISNSIIKAVWSIKNKYNNLTYIIGKLDSYVEFDTGEYKLKLIDPYKKGYFYIIVNKDYFKRKYSEKNKVLNAEYYISAMLKADVNLEAVKLESIPVIPGRGLPIDSSKEIEFAEMLMKNKILFTKPTLVISGNQWNGYLPDFLILDKQTRKVKGIAEVFGFYTEEYLAEMEEKIKYFSNLKDYKFVYWKANNNETMPNIIYQ